MTGIVNVHNAPTLLFDPTAWQKILTYVQLSPVEINGWGYVRVVNKSLLYVGDPDDVFITRQAVTGGSADNDATTVALAQVQANEVGRGDEMRLQWHSHVRGAPIFSGTDTGTMDRFGDAGATWLVSVVLNKYGRATGRLDMYTPLRASVELKLALYLPEDKDMTEACAQDILDLVDMRTFKKGPYVKGRPSQDIVEDRPFTETDLRMHDVAPNYLAISGA